MVLCNLRMNLLFSQCPVDEANNRLVACTFLIRKVFIGNDWLALLFVLDIHSFASIFMLLSVDDFSELFGSAAALISTRFYPTCLQYMEKSKNNLRSSPMIFWWSFAVDGFAGLPLDIRSRPERNSSLFWSHCCWILWFLSSSSLLRVSSFPAKRIRERCLDISALFKKQVKHRQVRWIALYGQQTYGRELCLIRVQVVLRRRWKQCCIRDCLPSWSDPGSDWQTSSSFAEPVPVAGKQFSRRLCLACKALVAWQAVQAISSRKARRRPRCSGYAQWSQARMDPARHRSVQARKPQYPGEDAWSFSHSGFMPKVDARRKWRFQPCRNPIASAAE